MATTTLLDRTAATMTATAVQRMGTEATAAVLLVWLRGMPQQGGKVDRDAGAAHDHGRIQARQRGSARHRHVADGGGCAACGRQAGRVGAGAVVVGPLALKVQSEKKQNGGKARVGRKGKARF